MRCQLGGEGLDICSDQQFGTGFHGVLRPFYSATPWNGRQEGDCSAPLVLLTTLYN
jgi:hypothetical protein